MTSISKAGMVVWAACAVGCGSSDEDGGGGGGTDYGQKELASLDEACEGVVGLTGRAILDQRADGYSTTLAYVTASGDRVDPTGLDVVVTWPATPVATCYPQYETSGPRVAIEGLSLTFKTADGKFDEALGAKAWLPVINGAPQFPQVIAATKRAQLAGSWQPFPEYAVTGDTTMGFVSRLAGAATANAGGNVSASTVPLEELGAGIFSGGFAIATWPHLTP
jgi:hypothetical protein